jgi:hypothetical protein
MIKFCKVNENGYFIEDILSDEIPQVFINDEMVNDSHYIKETPKNFYLPKFNFDTNEWVEGKPQSEIDEILNTSKPKSELELMQEALDFLLMGGM